MAVNIHREKEEKVFQCREHFPQVHSLAPVSIIDSQSRYKTGHSPCLFLRGVLGDLRANFNHKSLKDITSQWTVPKPQRCASSSNTVSDI